MKRSGRYGLRLLHRGTVELIKNGCNDSEPKAVMDGAKLFPEWEPQDLAEQLRATEKNQLPANRESSAIHSQRSAGTRRGYFLDQSGGAVKLSSGRRKLMSAGVNPPVQVLPLF